MKPLVSICIPCHNAASFVGAAIESVFQQTWKNLEVIVVDDASTDGSLDAIANFSSPHLKSLSATLGNACKSRNLAASHARGDFIKFLDADDILGPDSIRSQLERIQDQPTAVASGRWGRFQGSDLTTFQENPEPVWRDLPGPEWLVQSWRHARSMTQPGIFLMSRHVWETAGPWNEDLSLIDDFEFFTRVMCAATEVRFCPEAVLHYRSDLGQTLSARSDRAAVKSAFRSLDQGTRHLLQHRDDAEARLSCANLFQNFSYDYYPAHADLRARAEVRVRELGIADLPPSGPPKFQVLRRIIGWKLARRIQHWTQISS